MELLKALFLLLLCPARAIDNGLGLTPPRGWRSWNLFHANISTAIMETQMAAVVDTSRKVNGKPTTLASLGFDWISMDDGWQRCNCSAGKPGTPTADPALPACPNCKAGGCKWHDDAGKPVVDVRKFPDMKKMVEHGHSLGLKVGSYLNNCICMEGGDPPMGRNCIGETHYHEDVQFIIETGFDGVKIDNCGPSHNVTLWAELFNQSGKPIRIESCHTFHPNHGTPSGWPNFPVWDPATKGNNQACPMNLYRTGGDISPNFASVIGESYATVQYNDRLDPFSHPGCWAYPDMQEIGNFAGADPMRTDEENTHWGLWCIISAPLILGLDMSIDETMDRIWPTITNADALMINDAWVGHPGTLVKSYPSSNASAELMLNQAACTGGADTTGWRLTAMGKLQSPDGLHCVDGAQIRSSGPTGQSTSGMVACPPPTTKCGHTPCPGCGSILVSCDAATGIWTHDETTGVLQWNLTAQEAVEDVESGRAQCLSALLSAPVGGFYGGPKASLTKLGNCPNKNVPNTSTFTLTTTGELRAGTGLCIAARPLYGPQLWAKPLPSGKVAVLVVNLNRGTEEFKLPLSDVPWLTCSTSCKVRDVWQQKDLAPQKDFVEMTLREHQSGFFILSPSTKPL